MSRSSLGRVVHVTIAFVLLALGISVLALSIGETGNAAHKDFIAYWAAGQLLHRGSSPYDAEAVFRIEKAAGFSEDRPLVMRNPPFALVLALPLGVMSVKVGVVVWSVLIVAALMISIRLLWVMHGRPPDRLHLLGYVFAPALACVQLGQTPTFALLGLVLYLHFHRKKPLVAGLCIPLLAIKPQLLVPFGLILVVWAVTRRSYILLTGAAVGMVSALVVPMWLSPRLWTDYVAVLHTANSENHLIPTVSALVREIHPRADWMQVIPVAAACAWAIWYFRRHTRDWDWNREGLLLLLVSIWTAPYAWFVDEIILLPAILRGIYVCARLERPLISFGLVDAAALVPVLLGVPLGSGAFIWTSTAWLAWYIYALRKPALPAIAAAEARAT